MIIGITGGIASGKSICTNQFATYCIHIIDADIIARELVQPERKAWQAIVKHFGEEILLPDNAINRPALRERIFSNPKERLILNTILHPFIHQELVQLLQLKKESNNNLYQILSAPLLLENNLDSYCDLVISVDVPVETQIARGCKRDKCNVNHIKSIINTQISRTERIKRSHFIIDNTGSLDHTFLQIEKLHQKFMSFFNSIPAEA